MRRLALLLALPLVLAACGGEEGEGAACAATLRWNDEVYVGTGELPGRRPRLGRALEDGVQPGCNDGGEYEPDGVAAVRELAGVPPAIAVARGRRDIYLNVGFFTELASHPYHDRVTRDDTRQLPNGPRCAAAGAVTSTHSGLVLETRRVERMTVRLYPRTRVVGFDRGGLPYLERGDALRVRGRRCSRDFIAAERIEPQR